MRDPKRIDKILNLVGKIWKKFPDLRFGQLLNFIEFKKTEITGTNTTFYFEDEEWQEVLETIIKQKEEKL